MTDYANAFSSSLMPEPRDEAERRSWEKLGKWNEKLPYVPTEPTPKRRPVIDKHWWQGPHGIRVHSSLDKCIASDGVNVLHSSGTQTKKGTTNKLSKEKYLEKYCVQHGDNWYYNKNIVVANNHIYWIGPYEMRVSIDRGSCPAINHNQHYQDGSETEVCYDAEDWTRDAYLKQFATQGSDGFWYYNRN